MDVGNSKRTAVLYDANWEMRRRRLGGRGKPEEQAKDTLCKGNMGAVRVTKSINRRRRMNMGI